MPARLPPCGNPLFLSWVEELRDEARAKGSKSAETYQKACNSIKKCPVTYSRPRELVCLAAIGPKTVSILESRFKKHCEENGIVIPGSVEKKKPKRQSMDVTDDSEDIDKSPQPSKKNRKQPSIKPFKPYVPQKGSGGYGILLALVLAIEEPERNTQVFMTKGEIIKAAQPFCDSSYEHSEKGGYFTAWSTMKTLVGKGYIYVTGNPHKHCLTEEGYDVALVIRNLRPEFAHLPKYPFLHEPANDVSRRNGISIRQLSPESPVLRAESSLRGQEQITSQSSLPKSPVLKYYNPYPDEPEPESPAYTSKTSNNKPVRRPGLSDRVYDDESEEDMIAGPSRPRLPTRAKSPILNVSASEPFRSSKFEFWYIDSSGARTNDITSAIVRLDPVDFVNIRKVEFRSSQRSHPFVSQLKLVDAMPRLRDTSGQSTLFAFIVEEGAPPVCSRFSGGLVSSIPRVPSPPPPKSPKKGVLSLPEPSVSTFSRTASAPSASSREPSTAVRQIDKVSLAGPSRSHSTSSVSGSSKPSRQAPRLSSHIPTLTPRLDDFSDLAPLPYGPAAGPSKAFDFKPSDAIVFPAESYEIILILDTREVESKSNRDKIAETLLAKGVKVETRALKLGDMCWVARRLDGLGGEEDECVLDYVVERKRLDDLCSSIKDGRYNEQCFRLSSSCINHVYYIVEDWQVTERMAYDGLAIMTAKSQLQITNRFFLKETHKLSETIDFLATMTSVIQSTHKDTDLYVIPTRYLSRASYSALQAHLTEKYPFQRYLTSFQAYQDLNDKSGSRTLREKFARMLLCVKGMSAERVSAVLEVWETPREMWDALKMNGVESFKGGVDELPLEGGAMGKGKLSVRGPEMIFADLIKGEGRRKIGDSLSRDLYRAFMG